MVEKLEQERLLEKRTLILHSDRVEVKVSDRKSEHTEYFRFEDISNDKTFRRVKSQPNYGLYVLSRNASIILFFCTLFGAIEEWSWFFALFVSATVFFIIHAFYSASYIEILTAADKPLTLLKYDPTEEAVEGFVDSMYAKRNSYLKEHYYLPSDGSSNDGQSLLKQLLDMNVISQPEYDLKVNPVKGGNVGLN